MIYTYIYSALLKKETNQEKLEKFRLFEDLNLSAMIRFSEILLSDSH